MLRSRNPRKRIRGKTPVVPAGTMPEPQKRQCDVMITSKWCTAQELVDSGRLKSGDLIEFKRTWGGLHYYSHWAMYVKPEFADKYLPQKTTTSLWTKLWSLWQKPDRPAAVIHLSAVGDDFSATQVGIDVPQMDSSWMPERLKTIAKLLRAGGIDASVRCDLLTEVAGETLVRINNYMDFYEQPFPERKILDLAMEEMGKGDYHLIYNNCEHFCNYCRYGVRYSMQSQWRYRPASKL